MLEEIAKGIFEAIWHSIKDYWWAQTLANIFMGIMFGAISYVIYDYSIFSWATSIVISILLVIPYVLLVLLYYRKYQPNFFIDGGFTIFVTLKTVLFFTSFLILRNFLINN